MTYLRVAWRHQHRDEPVVLYSELDGNRFEVRKVEVFRDGRLGYADADRSSSGTNLGLVATPSLEEIAQDPQFEPVQIEPAEFEAMWERCGAG